MDNISLIFIGYIFSVYWIYFEFRLRELEKMIRKLEK